MLRPSERRTRRYGTPRGDRGWLADRGRDRIGAARQLCASARGAAVTTTARSGPTELRAVIPGRILAVSVAPGDRVTAGQQVMVVEAMKMQNELRAPRDGVVAQRGGRAGHDGRGRRPPAGARMSGARRATRAGAGARHRPPGRRSAGSGSRPLARAGPIQGAPERPRTARRVRDVVGDPDPRPLHAGGRRRSRRGPGPRPPRGVPVHPGRPADDVPEPLLDDAPVRRVRDGRGDEPPLPLPPGAGPDGAVRGLRPAHPDGLRLRFAPRRKGRSAGSASRSPASPTWRCSSRACPSSRSARP